MKIMFKYLYRFHIETLIFRKQILSSLYVLLLL